MIVQKKEIELKSIITVSAHMNFIRISEGKGVEQKEFTIGHEMDMLLYRQPKKYETIVIYNMPY